MRVSYGGYTRSFWIPAGSVGYPPPEEIYCIHEPRHWETPHQKPAIAQVKTRAHKQPRIPPQRDPVPSRRLQMDTIPRRSSCQISYISPVFPLDTVHQSSRYRLSSPPTSCTPSSYIPSPRTSRRCRARRPGRRRWGSIQDRWACIRVVRSAKNRRRSGGHTSAWRYGGARRSAGRAGGTRGSRCVVSPWGISMGVTNGMPLWWWFMASALLYRVGVRGGLLLWCKVIALATERMCVVWISIIRRGLGLVESGISSCSVCSQSP